MPIVQIWANNDDMETLRRLKAYLEHEQEERFGGKAWRMSSRRRRIRKEKINESYVYREALNSYWNEKEQAIRDFERHER